MNIVKVLVGVLSTWIVLVLIWLIVEHRSSMNREKSYILQISNLNNRLENIEKLKDEVKEESSNIKEEKEDLKQYLNDEKNILQQQRENLRNQLDNGRNNLQEMVDRLQQIKLIDKIEEKLKEIRPNENQTE